MLHVFLLVVMLNGAPQRTQPMYFYDIDRCLYFAERVNSQRDYSAICKITYVDASKVTVYK
jgi:hypothetical protein